MSHNQLAWSAHISKDEETTFLNADVIFLLSHLLFPLS